MSRPYPTHLRQSSVGAFGLSGLNAPSSSSPALVARIKDKQLELENLRQLRDLSGDLAKQLVELEEKLKTLADGSEAVAVVLGNWHNVLRAIAMASTKIPIPKEEEGQEDGDVVREGELPQMLVRVPTNLNSVE